MALVANGSKTLVGFKELAECFRQLPEDCGPKGILKKAVKKGGNIIAEEARARCPVKTGSLRASIDCQAGSTAIEKLDSNFAAVALVGTLSGVTKTGKKKLISRGVEDEDPSKYGRLVESGTRYTRPQPFLGPAFDTRIDDAINEIGNELAYQIDQRWSSGA